MNSTKIKNGTDVAKARHASISVRSETAEKLRTVRSCFQISGNALSYDEIISLLIEKGLPAVSRRVSRIYSLAVEEDGQDGQENRQNDECGAAVLPGAEDGREEKEKTAEDPPAVTAR